jgi:hypothetical protein
LIRKRPAHSLDLRTAALSSPIGEFKSATPGEFSYAKPPIAIERCRGVSVNGQVEEPDV